ncbi:cysteine proteinase, partial [Atractiella rhizophila]
TSTTYNTFTTLSLPVPNSKLSKVTLTQCLDLFVKEEIMEKGDAWNCPKCETQRKATKHLTLSKLPEVLVIHLKRFSFKGPFTDKLETQVHYPLQDLDMTPYLPPTPTLNECSVWNLPPECAKPQSLHYDLFGVINHFGNLSNGHYTAYVKSRQDWYNMDDSRVIPFDADKVQARSAYILFYRRR